MPKCIILQGIPCSGKSSWAHKQDNISSTVIISCDQIREDFYGKSYKFSKEKEDIVWDNFYLRIRSYSSLSVKPDIIIDNTNLRQKYIDNIKNNLAEDYEIEIKRFDVPLWKAHIRNIIRRIKTGKWIPIKVMNNFHKRYKQLT